MQYIENISCTQNGAESLHQVFIKSVQEKPGGKFLGTIKNGKVEYITYLDGYNRVRKIHSFIKKNEPGQGRSYRDILGQPRGMDNF